MIKISSNDKFTDIVFKNLFHQENLQKEKQQKTMEFKQLQETIIELRSKIENDTRRQKK